MTPTADVLGAVEALFGAGTSVAPMPGATLLRYLHKLQDPWTNGLHLDEEPDLAGFVEARSTWEAFERPGRIRWAAAPGAPVVEGVAEAASAWDLRVASRPVLSGEVVAGSAPDVPAGLSLQRIGQDIRDWAGFEVLARWIDLDEDPAVWRWRGQRVRNLVQGDRGAAVLVRSPSAPVGAAVLLRAPDHRRGAPAVIASVVHEAHRGKGVAPAMIAALAADHAGPVVVLGDGHGRLVRALAGTGLEHVADLVEVGAPVDGAGRKA